MNFMFFKAVIYFYFGILTRQIVCTLFSFVYIATEEDSAVELLEKILNFEDKVQADYLQGIIEQIFEILTKDLDLKIEESELSPTLKKRKRSPNKTSIEVEILLQKLQMSENFLQEANKKSSDLSSKLIISEEENQLLKDQVSKLKKEKQKLEHENEDFKSRANIGLIECLELDLQHSKSNAKLLNERLADKSNEYKFKLQDYQKRFEGQSLRINELEVQLSEQKTTKFSEGEKDSMDDGSLYDLKE